MGPIKSVVKGTRRILERMNPHRILFHHIPKCGGSAITQPFRMRSALSYHKVDEDAVLAIVDPRGELPFFARHEAAFAEKDRLCRYFAFSGTGLIQSHVPWFAATQEEALASYDRVTLLREPMSRFLSHYFWDKGRDNQNGIHMELEDFLQTEQALAFGSLMTRFLSGRSWPGAAAEPAAVDAAVAASEHFAVLGFLDNLQGFGAQIQSKFGWRMKFPVSNQGTVSNYEPLLKGPLAPRLREVCAPDLALYQRLKARHPRSDHPDSGLAEGGAARTA